MTNSSNTETVATQPLHHKWVLWFDNPRLAPEGSSWRENLHKCGTFDTPQSFWRIFNNVKPTSHLSQNSNYHVFREGVEPMWEDPENMNGGKFVLSIPKKDSKSGKLDEWWLFTLLAIIGETIDEGGDKVCGAVVSIRKGHDRIALWLKSDEKEACIKIGERWKKALELTSKTILKFQLHKEALGSGHSYKNDIKFEV